MSAHRRVIRVDYKTLVATVGVLVSLAVLLTVLDSVEARKDAARALAAKDEQIARRDSALDDAAKQSRANGDQIDLLIAQIQKQNDLVDQQQQVVSALRNELAKRGISTVVENGKVRVVPGPVATPGSVSSTSAVVRAAPGKSTAPRAARPTARPTTHLPAASPTTTRATPRATLTVAPTLAAPTLVLPFPLPLAATSAPTLPLVGDLLTPTVLPEGML